MNSLTKLALLGREPSTWKALASTQTTAAVEHLPVLRHVRPDTILDVGANKGQFSLASRAALPGVRIIAFEPLQREADIFRRNFAGAPAVDLLQVALSDASGRARFHVTDRRDSSSLLPLGTGASAAYNLNKGGDVEVELKRLDEVVGGAELSGNTLMKIDVQGAEMSVIGGAGELTNRIDYVYAELSFVPLYTSQALVTEVVELMIKKGFSLRGVHNISFTPAFGPTQADFLFENSSRVTAAR